MYDKSEVEHSFDECGKLIVNLLESTYPSEDNIDILHKEKSVKYNISLRDIPNNTLNCFDISSMGFISPGNHTQFPCQVC